MVFPPDMKDTALTTLLGMFISAQNASSSGAVTVKDVMAGFDLTEQDWNDVRGTVLRAQQQELIREHEAGTYSVTREGYAVYRQAVNEALSRRKVK